MPSPQRHLPCHHLVLSNLLAPAPCLGFPATQRRSLCLKLPETLLVLFSQIFWHEFLVWVFQEISVTDHAQSCIFHFSILQVSVKAGSQTDRQFWESGFAIHALAPLQCQPRGLQRLACDSGVAGLLAGLVCLPRLASLALASSLVVMD